MLGVFKVKRLIVDLDDTICATDDGDYKNSKPNKHLIKKLKEYQEIGFEIVISTSRNVRSYNGNLGKINAYTLPLIMDWLMKNDVPFDEVYVAKPWCGHEGFYIDDKAIRPSEFLNNSFQEIKELLEKEKCF